MAKRKAGEGTVPDRVTIGIVRPISSIEPYPAEQWEAVHNIIADALTDEFDLGDGYDVRLVSEGEGSALIHGRIVQNIYSNDLIICDLSSRNANVMLEFGLRLAFNKPVIAIKDDITPFMFDASPIEHLIYSANLRHPEIERFKIQLKEKVGIALEGKGRSFLDHFGKFEVAAISNLPGTDVEVLQQEIRDVRNSISQLTSSIAYLATSPARQQRGMFGNTAMPVGSSIDHLAALALGAAKGPRTVSEAVLEAESALAAAMSATATSMPKT